MIENIKYCYLFTQILLWIVVFVIVGINLQLFTDINKERHILYKHRFKFLGVGIAMLIVAIISQNIYFLIYGV